MAQVGPRSSSAAAAAAAAAADAAAAAEWGSVWTTPRG